MINKKNIKIQYLLIVLIAFAFVPSILYGQIKDDTNYVYKVLDIKKEIAPGKGKEINLLFEDDNTKVAQIILRNGNRLESHSVEDPILIECTNGKGELLIENGKKREKVPLNSGVVVAIKGNVLHDIIADPKISILLIRYNINKTNPN